MATISARVDDQTKARAEEIADSIGIPLSSAINVFLRRFVLENGFPFEVKTVDASVSTPLYDLKTLEPALNRAVANPNNPVPPDHFTYFDPETKKPVIVYNSRKER